MSSQMNEEDIVLRREPIADPMEHVQMRWQSHNLQYRCRSPKIGENGEFLGWGETWTEWLNVPIMIELD